MRALLGLLLLVAAATAGFAAYAWHPALDPIETPTAGSFPKAVIRRGATLAALGNCQSCHTAPGEPAYSGGVPIPTPFGTVYGSNLTPDPSTGIGRWSLAAFGRAMRQGLDRQGRHLYPAFPYDHFTHVTDDDNQALYAYLMTRPAVSRPTPSPALVFPLSFRPLMAGWKLLFFHPGPVPPTPWRNAETERGAYLVEGLGHCGACHTPRNALGAERASDALGGGVAEGWNAYAINAASPAPIPWTAETLAFYLAHGWQAVHGVSRGPMAAVTANLGTVPAGDVAAMAQYLVARMGPPSPERSARAEHLAPPQPGGPMGASAGTQEPVPVAALSGGAGAAIYAGACASCHDSRRAVPFGGLPLVLSSALHAPDPTNIVTVTLHGLAAPPGEAGAIMPGFDGTLTDGQIVDLLAYLRGTVAGEAPWPHLPDTVRKARTQAVTLFPSDGTSRAPALTDIRVAP